MLAPPGCLSFSVPSACPRIHLETDCVQSVSQQNPQDIAHLPTRLVAHREKICAGTTSARSARNSDAVDHEPRKIFNSHLPPRNQCRILQCILQVDRYLRKKLLLGSFHRITALSLLCFVNSRTIDWTLRLFVCCASSKMHLRRAICLMGSCLLLCNADRSTAFG